MKLLFLLPVFLAAVSLGRAQEEPSSADLFQQFLDVEAELKEQWKNDFEAFRQKKQDEQAKLQELIDAMNQKFKEQADKIKETYDQFQQAKEQREAEKAAHRQEVMDELKKAFQIFSDYKKEEKEREKQQTIDLYNELKKKWDEKVQEAAETKKQQLDDYKNSIDQMQTKWSDWVNKMNEAKKQAWDKQKQKLEQAKQEFEELKQLMEQELQRRTEAKQQRKEEHKKAIDQYRSDIQTKKDELDQLEAEAIEQMNTVQQKKNEITGLMMKIMNDQTKAYWDEKMYAKVQQNLDMAAAKEVFDRNEPNWGSGKDKWGGAGGKGKGAGGKGEGAGGKWEGQDGLLDKIHKHGPSSVLDENKNKGKSTPAPPVAEMPTEDVQKVQPDYMESDNVVGGPEPRATLLDQITGTSQWQTVTWILLALSILLVIALIALIMYQIQQRKHYQELEGHNDPERAPLTRYPEGLQYSDVGVPLPKV